MAQNATTVRKGKRLLRADKAGNNKKDRTPADTFRENLYALKFEAIPGKKILDMFDLPVVTTRRDILKAMIVHSCLIGYKKYIPKLFDKVDETVHYILSEANKLVPGYELKSTNDTNIDYSGEDAILGDIKESRYFIDLPIDSVFYPTRAEELITEYKGLIEHKDQPYYPILINTMRLLWHMNIEDVRENSGWESSEDKNLYDPEDDHWEQMVHMDIEYTAPDNVVEAAAKEVKAEYRFRKKVVHPLIKEIKKPAEINLLRTFVTFDSNSDLSNWVTHVLKMHDHGFDLFKFIMDLPDEDRNPINASNCIGFVFDGNQRCYRYHFYDISAFAQEAGYTPIGPWKHIGMDGRLLTVDPLPVMAWLRKALSFNLSSLTYD